MSGTFTPNETRAAIVNEAARRQAIYGLTPDQACKDAVWERSNFEVYWNGLKRSARYALIADVRKIAERDGDELRAAEREHIAAKERVTIEEAATIRTNAEPESERRGPGAPRKLDGAKAATFILTDGIIERIEATARARGMSRSEFVRAAVESAIEAGV